MPTGSQETTGGLPIVARCDTCGRGYVWVNPRYDPPKCLATNCGGIITPEPPTEELPPQPQDDETRRGGTD